MARSWLVAGFVATALVASGAPTSARATVLTFDDISTSTLGTIPNGYGGFVWSDFGFIDGFSVFPGSGFDNGTVSGSYTSFNELAQVATINDAEFTFVSAYFTSAWNTELSINLEAFQLGVKLFETITPLVVDPFAPTLFTFNWSGIDELLITSSGGPYAGLGGSGAIFAMDDFSFEMVTAPEPAAPVLVAAGLLVLAALRRRV